MIAKLTRRNARLGIRGALLVSDHHVAEILEGPDVTLDDLLPIILADPLQQGGIVIERKPIEGYRFADWGLVYRGSATYIDQKVASLLAKQGASAMAEARELEELMRLLARESSKQQGPIGRPSQS